MTVVLGVLLGAGLATAIGVGWMRIRAPRAARTPETRGMQSALHAATATLPHLRRGLTPGSAAQAVPHLRALTGAAAVALADTANGAGDRWRGPRAGAAGGPALAAAGAHPR